MAELWRVDLHSHTRFSPDSLVDPEAYVARVRRTGLDRIAVTDHNTIDGALIAYKLAPDLVIVGEEIDTGDGGELIAFYVHEALPAGLPMMEAIERLREQGAVISVSHPVDRHRGSAMGESNTRKIAGLVDALEVFNARCLTAADNVRAAELARQYGKAVTAGSDGHTLRELGAAFVSLPPFEDNPTSFLSSLVQAQAGGRLTGIAPHFWSTWAKWRKHF